MTRLGLAFSGSPLTVREASPFARLAENMGFESVWIAEDYYQREAIAYLTAFSLATQRIKLGLGVINPYTRNIALIAMTAASMDELSAGRFLLGIGTGVRFMERMGVTIQKPLAFMRETIQVLRRIFSGEKVTLEGQTLRLEQVKLDFEPPRDRIPIYLAAIGPRMLELGGEIADGVLLTAAASPKYVEYALEHVRSGAEKAGRDRREIDVASYVLCSMSGKGKAPNSSFVESVAFQIATADLDFLRLCGLENEGTRIKEAWNVGGVAAAARLVKPEILDALAIWGDAERCSGGLKRYLSAGVDLPIIWPYGSKPEIENAIRTFSRFIS